MGSKSKQNRRIPWPLSKNRQAKHGKAIMGWMVLIYGAKHVMLSLAEQQGLLDKAETQA